MKARAAGGSETTEFALAYSTAEVGNSGWRKFSVSHSLGSKSFEWDVPTMKNGHGDYVGILPTFGPGVEIETLAVEAITR